MGLFVDADGHYVGWLAALLCCIAAVNEDEDPVEKQKARSVTQSSTCTQQPLPLAELPATPLPLQLAAFKGDDLLDYHPRHRPRISDRPPSIKPLELDETPLINRWSLIGKPKTSPVHVSKPSISAPYAFRRLDATDSQKQSLVPLRLGPVVLRESPVPPEVQGDDGAASNAPDKGESTEDLLQRTARPQSYRSNRDSPFQRCVQRSSGIWPMPPPPTVLASEQQLPTDEGQKSARPPLVARSSSGSLRRSTSRDGSAASSISSRPSNERIRPRRIRSQQSIRKSGSDIDDLELEKEVMELNTIVEERRAENSRGSANDQHVAAIAPAMEVRARAETLDAIGSALSRPLTSHSYYRTTPIAPATDSTAHVPPVSTSRKSTSRVSGWLSGMFPSASTTHLPNDEPFYKCQRPAVQRSRSADSISSGLTEMDSPSLTAASSPTSKGHSRSHTGESRITAVSPATTYYQYGDTGRRKGDDHWPVLMTPTSLVGVAL